MKKILIADSNKASLVMTSEIFKDNYPGIQVCVANNSREALIAAKEHSDIDFFIIDFDLPDSHGAETALELKKISLKPVLITGFDREDVARAIESTLHEHNDCQNWLKKPIAPDVLTAVVSRFLDGKIRLQKRISCSLPALIELGTVLFHAIIEDCSLNGLKLKIVLAAEAELKKLKKGSNILVKTLDLNEIRHGSLEAVNQKYPFQDMTYSVSMNGKIIWVLNENKGCSVGIEFENQKSSKELFEVVVSLQLKHNRNCHYQTALKPSRI